MNFRKFLMGTLIVLFFLDLALVAQPRRTLNPKVQSISKEDASKRWQEFSSSKQSDNFFFSFELKHLPRRDKETKFFGNMLGKRIDNKYYTRLQFNSENGKEYDYLFEIDELKGKYKAFKYDFNENKALEIKENSIMEPLAENLIYTPFDILMMYKYWQWQYLKEDRITQAVYIFKLKSPYDWVGDVEIALSREFNSPIQTQFFDKSNELKRTFSLGSVKKIDNFWILKSAEIKNESNKDKDKLSIISANMRENLDKKLFTKENLSIKIERILLELL